MRTVLIAILLVALKFSAAADPIRVANLTSGSPGQLVADALADLGERVKLVSAGDVSQLPPGSVLLLDGVSDLSKFPVGKARLEEFVSRGGGVLIAGLPDSLPLTAALWRALGAAAPVDVPAADLFPDDRGDWMWIAMQKGETPDHVRYIRKDLEIRRPVKRAFMRCTVDNLYWAYLNGEQIGYHWSWYDYELWDITGKLRQGRNVIPFKARNIDGPPGSSPRSALSTKTAPAS